MHGTPLRYSYFTHAYNVPLIPRYVSEAPIWLDDLRCTSSDTSLKNCRHSGIGIHNCDHREDVILACLAGM